MTVSRKERRMSSALIAGLFAILGTGLACTSAACWVLWRRVRELTSASAGSPGAVDGSTTVSVVLPKGPAKSRNNDDWARRLDELLGKHRALEARVAKLEASEISPAPAPVKRGLVASRAARRVDPGASATASGPTLISVPDLAAPPASNSEAAAELDRRFGPVWAMADAGMAADAIARETRYPIGQVELILGLRRRLLVAEAGPDV
jgi:hypothetical protein